MNGKRWINQFTQLESTSKFHEELRLLFSKELPFKRFNCYQELNVQELFPEYPYVNHAYDWYIQELDTIIELHGKQHYTPVNYGNSGGDDLLVEFRRIQWRDSLKANIAIANNKTYIEIPYKAYKKLSTKLLLTYLEQP